MSRGLALISIKRWGVQGYVQFLGCAFRSLKRKGRRTALKPSSCALYTRVAKSPPSVVPSFHRPFTKVVPSSKPLHVNACRRGTYPLLFQEYVLQSIMKYE